MRTLKWSPITDDEFNRQYEAAVERGRHLDETEPLAVAARYDADSGRVVVHLDNGCVFTFPAELGQGLRGATVRELAEVEISPAGVGLHWPTLDADLRVASLLRGVFGSRRWMREIGARADA